MKEKFKFIWQEIKGIATFFILVPVIINNFYKSVAIIIAIHHI